MNYIRGAVNAISAPYQYYKDLPPINPSTLTGAIDVIVIQRPADAGDSELVCSPFHVRFGKWQVLRPGEKKVNVSVNGTLIPFYMKIGEAGEAFFVFETDDDVPADLITSPILAPTVPEQPPEPSTGRFGAKNYPDGQDSPGEEIGNQEPEFLDLDAPPPSALEDDSAFKTAPLSPSQQDPPTAPMLTIQPPVQEYSWEWGAFPQPSPMKTSFGKGGRFEGPLGSGKEIPAGWAKTIGKGKGKGKGARLRVLDPDDEEERDGDVGVGKGKGKRSRSVPPELEGSPNRKWREIPLYEEYDGSEEEEDEGGEGGGQDGLDESEVTGFGAGGRLTASKSDPTRFVLSIEGRKVGFELSSVPSIDEHWGSSKELERGRGNGDGNRSGFDGWDEVEAARLFGEGKITFERFLDNESIVSDPRLVIRWVGDQYITRNDGSPLMHALILWRNTALLRRARGLPSRPASPFSEDEGARSTDESVTAADGRSYRSKSESPEGETESVNGKPTSSSWVKWWSRSRNNHQAGGSPGEGQRPGLRLSSSEVLEHDLRPSRKTWLSKDIPPAESAPALPSTPVAAPVKDVCPATQENSEADPTVKRKFAKTLRLTSDQLKSLNLKPGPNAITFSLSTSGIIACTARIFLWDSTDLVLVSDIDGTITKSDGLGHVFAMIGRDWTHLGVAKLYTDIARNGYKVMYLTSRAIGQADATRDYLRGIKQNDYQLPEGPVIMSPDRLMASLHREVIMRKPEVFKMACLRDIQRLFGEAVRNPFYAGFGNRITDALSYRSVNVPSSRIFTIDSTGEVKLELLELAGYKSSYIHMTDLVDQMFPPIHRKWAPEFTDFNYWKAPIQEYPLPDLSPPSPALSARSDTSNQSTLARLRNFSLVGSRQTNNARQIALSAADPSVLDKGNPDSRRSSQLRQMSSFERLSSTIAGFAPSSPSSSTTTFVDSDGEDMEEGWDRGGERQRRRSMTSMPGSLDDDIQFGVDDEGVYHDGDVEEGSYMGEGDDEVSEGSVEDEEEEAFNEDLFAAGEMKNVPFL